MSDCSDGEGAIVEAMDMDLLISPTVVEAILVVRVCVAGLRGPGIGNPFACISWGPDAEVLLFGIILPLMV
jgi:hypothetical protein